MRDLGVLGAQFCLLGDVASALTVIQIIGKFERHFIVLIIVLLHQLERNQMF